MSSPKTKAASYIASACVLYILSTTIVVLRLLAARVRKRDLKAHDYLVLCCLACFTGYIIETMIFGIARGAYGAHMWEISDDAIASTLKAFWISEWFWVTSVTAFRLSILLLYMEIFRETAVYYIALGTSIVVFLYWIACMLTISLLCRPVAFNWDKKLTGTCGDVVAIEAFSGAFNMAVDLWVVILPLPAIWNLQMTLQKKWGIFATFGFGLCTTAVNLGRLIQTLQCPGSPDLTYCVHGSSILIMSEMAGGILAASVPTLGPLFFNNTSNQHNRYVNEAGDEIYTIGSEPRERMQNPHSTLGASLFIDHEEEEYFKANSYALTKIRAVEQN